jgi:hypothetical protein
MKGTAVFATMGALSAAAAAANASPDQASRPDDQVGVSTSSPPVEPTGPNGFELGVRLGYSLPIGGVAQDASLRDVVSGRFPLWLDVGYRVNPRWYFGAFLQYGFMSVPSSFCSTCSLHDITGGVGAMFHVAPYAFLDPWIGAGFGYESLSGSDALGGTVSLAGVQFGNLQAGLDYYLHDLGVGPYVSLSVAQYSLATVTVPSTGAASTGGTTAGDIKGQILHEWFTIGLRATYDIALAQ